jgi:non-ribosomal peptide synthetase component F
MLRRFGAGGIVSGMTSATVLDDSPSSDEARVGSLGQGVHARRDLAYWAELLAERPAPIDLPCDRARPAVRSPVHERVTMRVPSSLAARLEHLARGLKVRPMAIFLAAYAVFLSKAACARELVVGVALAPGADPLPLPVRFAEVGLAFSTFAGKIDDLLPREGERPVSLDAILAALAIPPDPARHPLFDVGFGEHVPHGDLHVRVAYGQDAGTGLELTYDANIFTRARAERLLAAFLEVLRAVGADVDAPVGKIGLLSADEARHLLVEFSHPVFNWPKHFLLHALFEAKVDQAPDAVALVAGEERLTYADLDARANAVAAALVQRGVGPDVIVALVFDRTPLMIVAILAVLKAGARISRSSRTRRPSA